MSSKIVKTSKKNNLKPLSRADVLENSIAYFNGDELAANVWINKYALKDSEGNIFESNPDAMHRRIAKEVARIELKYPNSLTEKDIYNLIKDFKYIVPQGGPMANIGNKFQRSSLSNCFVIGDTSEHPSDSYGGILKIDQEQIQLMKRRGGVGHDLSHIRPRGSEVQNSALTSTGIVPFMERYSNSTREVAQDGRRGALMLSISVKHPDAESFIDAKLEAGKVTGANVSVRIDDAFMKAVKEDTMYTQQYPVDVANPEFTREVRARDIWSKMIHNAWKSAEPGMLFWDTVINESIPDCYADLGYKTVSTNPCGEIPLCPYDSCRLLALNLYSYVNNPFTEKAEFDFELFKKHSQLSLRIMDDIIDLELEKIDDILAKIDSDPESEEVKRIEKNLWLNIRHKAQEGRRTGVGITAEGDMLAALGLKYASDEGRAFSTEVHKTLAIEAYRSSVHLAKDRGAFPIFDHVREKENPFINRLKEIDPQLYFEMTEYGRRNIALLTIAPTGTTSLMTQTTSGIEPVFMPVYKRRRKVNPNDKDVRIDFVDEVGDSWEEYVVYHHKFIDWMKVTGIEVKDDYTNEEIDELVKKSPYFESTANDVNWLNKVKMQGEIQKYVDHSISVTVNLPNDTKEELVDKIYMTAWEHGCKGCTIYRDGSRSGVLISNDAKETATDLETDFPKTRPQEIEAEIIRFKNKRENWIAFIGLYNGKPYEIFTGIADDEEGIVLPKSVSKGVIIKGKEEDGTSRYDFKFTNKRGFKTIVEGLSYKFDKDYWNYAKLISGVLRHGMPLEQAVELVSSLHLDSEHINTWKNGVARALKRFIPDGTESKSTCSNCDSEAVIYQEGCLICKDCGSSKCG